jgi:hypothetical protein
VCVSPHSKNRRLERGTRIKGLETLGGVALVGRKVLGGADRRHRPQVALVQRHRHAAVDRRVLSHRVLAPVLDAGDVGRRGAGLHESWVDGGHPRRAGSGGALACEWLRGVGAAAGGAARRGEDEDIAPRGRRTDLVRKASFSRGILATQGQDPRILWWDSGSGLEARQRKARHGFCCLYKYN